VKGAEIPVDMEFRAIANVVALTGFAVAVVSGIFAGNAATTVLLRGIIVMLISLLLGRAIAWVLHQVRAEFIDAYEKQQPVPVIDAPGSSTDSPPLPIEEKIL